MQLSQREAYQSLAVCVRDAQLVGAHLPIPFGDDVQLFMDLEPDCIAYRQIAGQLLPHVVRHPWSRQPEVRFSWH